MAIEWVTGPAILAQAGNKTPTPADSEWADACASAVSAGLDHALEGADLVTPSPAAYPELAWAALGAGVESYKRREAVFGITGYADLQGAAIRVARDYLEGFRPIIARYATTGIA